MVAIPAVLESGEKTQFCSSLLDPKETMTMTVTLRDKDMNMTLLQMTSSEDFHNCQVFEVGASVNLYITGIVENDIIEIDLKLFKHRCFSRCL